MFMCGYAFHNWYRAALFLVLTMAVVERPDFPKQVAGIPGLNPWNLLLGCTLIAFVISRAEKRPALSGGLKFLIIFYLFFIFIAFLRAYMDVTGIVEFAESLGAEPISKTGIIIDDLINTLKYVAPAFLVYFGCNSYTRIREAMWAIVIMNCVLALLVVKSMGVDGLGSGTEMEQTAIRRLDRDTGYYRSDLAILLAGASWAIFAFSRFVPNPILRLSLVGGAAICAMAIGLSGGRMGMAAWGVLALAFSLLRWRRLLIMAPIATLIIFAAVPAVQDRLLQGFGDPAEDEQAQASSRSDSGDGGVDLSSVTSGRTVIWPYVIEEIKNSPFVGNGRRAMQRIGLSALMKELYDSPFPHPHNAYLQLFLDNGLLLGFPILLFHILILIYSTQMMRDESNPVYVMVGSVAFAFCLSFLVGSIAQQSFYPFTSSVCMWISYALLLRVRSEKSSIKAEPILAGSKLRAAKATFAPAKTPYETWLTRSAV